MLDDDIYQNVFKVHYTKAEYDNCHNTYDWYRYFTINRLFHKRLPETVPMDLNKIFLLDEII